MSFSSRLEAACLEDSKIPDRYSPMPIPNYYNESRLQSRQVLYSYSPSTTRSTRQPPCIGT
ncbi:hypothetical protein LIA77_02899 [Sarocladium implicatum]|nr:hypothetical protein LIA77_02899 [Sarocladium implicatum]